MKRGHPFTVSILFSLVCSVASFAQDMKPAVIDTGRIDNAIYRIVIPANWNHNLVMYAHGYEMPSMPSNPKMFQSSRNDMSVKPFLDRGFAVARSAYSKKGWALPEGVDETEALRKYFFSKYGKPDTCFITGHSMGGGITLATIENFSRYYRGAMPMCPLSNHPYLQTKMAFDINLVFAAMFPGVLPSMADVMNDTAPAISMPAIASAISKDTATAATIARRYELKPGDLPMVIMFNDGIIRDIRNQAGGNPFDNTNTIYSIFPDNLYLNRKIERLSAKPGCENFFEKYDRTGNIRCPTLLLHTIYDQLIPAGMAVIPFDNMVHEKGRQADLVVVYTKGQGHCNFTPQETGKAFDLLRKWVASGKRPGPGYLE